MISVVVKVMNGRNRCPEARVVDATVINDTGMCQAGFCMHEVGDLYIPKVCVHEI